MAVSLKSVKARKPLIGVPFAGFPRGCGKTIERVSITLDLVGSWAFCTRGGQLVGCGISLVRYEEK